MLRHLLWRMSEGQSEAFQLTLRAACTWPSCQLGQVSWSMQVDPKEPKVAEAQCPLCSRPLQLLSARPM